MAPAGRPASGLLSDPARRSIFLCLLLLLLLCLSAGYLLRAQAKVILSQAQLDSSSSSRRRLREIDRRALLLLFLASSPRSNCIKSLLRASNKRAKIARGNSRIAPPPAGATGDGWPHNFIAILACCFSFFLSLFARLQSKKIPSLSDCGHCFWPKPSRNLTFGSEFARQTLGCCCCGSLLTIAAETNLAAFGWAQILQRIFF